MISRAAFSDNAQITLKVFYQAIFYWPKIQTQSQWQEIWQRASKQCHLWWESDMFSFRKVNAEEQPCLPCPSQQNSAVWMKKILSFCLINHTTSGYTKSMNMFANNDFSLLSPSNLHNTPVWETTSNCLTLLKEGIRKAIRKKYFRK